MIIETKCPSCSVIFSVAESQLNKWVHCAQCRATFQVRPVPPVQPEEPPVSEPVAATPIPAGSGVESKAFDEIPPVTNPRRRTDENDGSGTGGWPVWLTVAIVFGVIRLALSGIRDRERPTPPAFQPPAFQFPKPNGFGDDHNKQMERIREMLANMKQQQALLNPLRQRKVLSADTYRTFLTSKLPTLRAMEFNGLALQEPKEVATHLNTENRFLALMALFQDGVNLEPEIHAFLANPAEQVRLDIVDLLRERGTLKSVDPLKQREQIDVSQKVRQRASEAWMTIEQREQE